MRMFHTIMFLFVCNDHSEAVELCFARKYHNATEKARFPPSSYMLRGHNKTWLEEEEEEWRKSFGTYLPSTHSAETRSS